MKLLHYFLLTFLYSCNHYNFDHYKKKSLSSECDKEWEALTKYLKRDKDGYLNLKSLPKEKEYHTFLDYELFSNPGKFIESNKECYYNFSKSDIKKIFGKPTVKKKLSANCFNYTYYLRVEEDAKCPNKRVTRKNKYYITSHNNPFSNCNIISITFDENNKINSIRVH